VNLIHEDARLYARIIADDAFRIVGFRVEYPDATDITGW
jgi:hypothetical protein